MVDAADAAGVATAAYSDARSAASPFYAATQASRLGRWADEGDAPIRRRQMAAYDGATPLSLAHLCALDVPPADLAAMAGQAGFASIGVRAMPAVPGGVHYDLERRETRAALRASLAASGVALMYVELIGLDRGLEPRRFRHAIEAGAELGATRLAVAGDDPDIDLVAAKMAELCDIALPLGIAVDLEFMPFRAIGDLAAALAVVARAARPNAHVLVDALHMFRSRSDPGLLARADPALLGTFQLCDAGAAMPVGAAALAEEARTRRLLPGDGALDLGALIAALPAPLPLGVEVPLAGVFPGMGPAQGLGALARAARRHLRGT
jgi:sugar phosphate isomerase/epimerase